MERTKLTSGQFAYVDFRNIDERNRALEALNNVSIAGKKLRVSKAQSYAKMLLDPYQSDMSKKSLEMSAKAGIIFKDIDLKKALETLNKEFYAYPPSPVVVLKNIVAIEEVG